MLTRLGVTAGDLVVEGSLAANPAYSYCITNFVGCVLKLCCRNRDIAAGF